MDHLDQKSLEALWAREPAQLAHFARHLASPCEICERFLAESSGPGLLDGEVDALLLSLAPRRVERFDELGFARIRRALRQERGAWLPALAGLAAGLLVFAGLGRLASRDDGLKGASRISVELQASVLTAGGRVARLEPGASLDPADTVLLRYHASEAGSAVVVAEREGAPPEVVDTVALEPGTHDLAGRSGTWGFSLRGERGRIRLWMIARPGPLAPDAAVARDVVEGVREAPDLGRAGVELRVGG